MGAGKFFPGGSKRDKSPKEEEKAPEPIRAVEPPKKKAGGGLFPGAKSRFSKPIDAKNRPGAVVISVIFCVIFISIGWYYGAVRPARVRAAQYERELIVLRQKQAEEAKKLEEMKKAEELKKASARAIVKVDTKPSKIKVILGDVNKMTPAVFEGVMPGKATLTITLDGYRSVTKELTLEGEQTADLGIIELVPRSGDLKLTTPLSGVTYTATGPNNFSRSGTLPASFEKLPEGDYSITASHRGWQLPAVTVTVTDQKQAVREFKFGYGSITLQSDPSGATVKRDRTVIGQTPLTLSDLRPAVYRYTLEKEGYRTARVQEEVKDFGANISTTTLEKTRDFTNATGIALIWIADGYWVGKFELSQGQYEKILGAGSNASIFRGANRPVENVTWQQAIDYCERLTQAEQAAGKLPAGYAYTLPTEAQFNTYLADADFSTAVMAYNASPSSTADIGSSDPNELGIYDVLGNVWEWCMDPFDADGRAHVMRGGGWLSTKDSFPNKGTRNGGAATFRDKFTGFRVVLVKKAN